MNISQAYVLAHKAAEDSTLISAFDVSEVAEDEFDPIPVLITKNPQGKKERLGKRKELDISSLQNSNVPNVERGESINI